VYGPSLVITPSAADFEETLRITFPLESESFDQFNGPRVGGLNIGFQPMQLEVPEGMRDRLDQPFPHQSPSGMRHERVIAKRRRLKESSHDSLDVDGAYKFMAFPQHDEEI
jgi:hypothetical protein